MDSRWFDLFSGGYPEKRDGSAEDKDKGWVGEDEGWVDRVPSPYSA